MSWIPAVLLLFAVGTRAGAAQAQRALDGSDLVPVVRAHIVQTVGCSAADVVVRSAGSVQGISVPEGTIAFRILQKGQPGSYRNLLVGVEVAVDGKPARTFWITVDASVHGRFARAKRRIPYGTALTADDVEIVDAEIPNLRSRYLKSEAEAVGQVARRLLTAGEPLSTDAVSPPYLVRTGQTVRLRVERQRVAVAALVRAEQDGRLGQMVTVRNLDFSRRLKARVVGRGEVTID